MLRRIFGPKRDNVTEEWRKLHIEELKKEDWPNVEQQGAKENISA